MHITVGLGSVLYVQYSDSAYRGYGVLKNRKIEMEEFLLGVYVCIYIYIYTYTIDHRISCVGRDL